MAKASNDKPAKKDEQPKQPQSAPPVTPERAYFDKVSQGHNPNVLENRYANMMTLQQAEDIVNIKYKDFAGTELPVDLAQAKNVLKNLNPS